MVSKKINNATTIETASLDNREETTSEVLSTAFNLVSSIVVRVKFSAFAKSISIVVELFFIVKI
jgi:hypothetical protein